MPFLLHLSSCFQKYICLGRMLAFFIDLCVWHFFLRLFMCLLCCCCCDDGNRNQISQLVYACWTASVYVVSVYRKKKNPNKNCSLSNSDAAANVPPPHEISIESPAGDTIHELDTVDTTVSGFFHLVQHSVAFPTRYCLWPFTFF